MLGRAVHYRNERQVDVGRTHTRKFYLCFFGCFFKPLHCHLVLRKVYARILFEGLYEEVDNLVVEVITAQMSIAVGRKHFKYAVADLEN